MTSGASKTTDRDDLTGRPCPICKTGRLEPGHTTLTLERGRTTIVVKEVPAQVCDACGEGYTEAEVTDAVLEMSERAASEGVEFDVRRFMPDELERAA